MATGERLRANMVIDSALKTKHVRWDILGKIVGKTTKQMNMGPLSEMASRISL